MENIEEQEAEKQPPILVLDLNNGIVVAGILNSYEEGVVALQTPMLIAVEYDEDDNPDTFNLTPYLAPFIKFEEETVIPFFDTSVASVCPASEVTTKAYLAAIGHLFQKKILKKNKSIRANEYYTRREYDEVCQLH